MVSTVARHWRLRAAHASSGFDLAPDHSGPVLCTVYAQVEIAGKEDLVFGSRPLCPGRHAPDTVRSALEQDDRQPSAGGGTRVDVRRARVADAVSQYRGVTLPFGVTFNAPEPRARVLTGGT